MIDWHLEGKDYMDASGSVRQLGGKACYLPVGLMLHDGFDKGTRPSCCMVLAAH